MICGDCDINFQIKKNKKQKKTFDFEKTWFFAPLLQTVEPLLKYLKRSCLHM